MQINSFISGAIFMACCTAGMFFLGYWRVSKDRFFGIFSLTFWLLALERVCQLSPEFHLEEASNLYWIRLLAFACLLVAIWDKNRGRRTQ